jgi:glycosyltransferase involved in cell wall biosynthesis
LDLALERRVATSADAVVGITEPIAQDFSERYGSTVYEVPSGWDRDRIDADVASASPAVLHTGFVHLVHTGSLSMPERRDPRPLFNALEALVTRNPDAATRLRLTLAGATTSRDRQMLDALPASVRAVVNVVGFLPRPQALALQRASDALLLFSTGPHRQVVSAKLSEYLLARRPIVAILPENEAARIVRQTHTGIVVAPDDIDGIRDALLSCLDGRLAASFEPRRLERYVQPAPAVEFSAIIEMALARRARRR